MPINLKVLEAYTRDVGRGVARLDYDSMDELEVSTGDCILINGKGNTPAKCLPLYPSDEGKGIVRIDGLVRGNAAVAIGDEVIVSKAQSKLAEKLVIKESQPLPRIDSKYVGDALESNYVKVGDEVLLPYFGGRLKYKVVEVKPDGVVQITQKTECTIQSHKSEVNLDEFTKRMWSTDYDTLHKFLELKSQPSKDYNINKLVNEQDFKEIAKSLWDASIKAERLNSKNRVSISIGDSNINVYKDDWEKLKKVVDDLFK